MRATGLPMRTSRVSKSARRAKSPPATAIAATSATAEATLVVVLSLLSPSELGQIAGTTSCRPITA